MTKLCSTHWNVKWAWLTSVWTEDSLCTRRTSRSCYLCILWYILQRLDHCDWKMADLTHPAGVWKLVTKRHSQQALLTCVLEQASVYCRNIWPGPECALFFIFYYYPAILKENIFLCLIWTTSALTSLYVSCSYFAQILFMFLKWSFDHFDFHISVLNCST